jgi:hypothetical protein
VFDVPRYFDHGNNYGGSGILGQANYEYWTENFDETKGKTWWDLGKSGILVRLDLLTSDQRDALDSLEGYPLLDEDRHSELEQEAQTDAWNDYARNDFKRDIVKLVDEEDKEQTEELLDAITDKELDKQVWELWQSAERYPEGGDEVSFPNTKELFDRPSWQKANTAGHIEPWDRSLGDLLRFLPETTQRLHVHYTLADAAFAKTSKTERVLRIKNKDLPSGLTSAQRDALVHHDGFSGPYDAEICKNLYIDCEWDFSSLQIQQAGERRRRKK